MKYAGLRFNGQGVTFSRRVSMRYISNISNLSQLEELCLLTLNTPYIDHVSDLFLMYDACRDVFDIGEN